LPKKFHEWLITGGCGFIGLNLVKRLVEEGGNYIRILDNLSVGSREDLGRICQYNELDASGFVSAGNTSNSPSSNNKSSKSKIGIDGENKTANQFADDENPSIVELVVGDILDASLTLKAAQGMEVIVHLAANTGVYPSVQNPRVDMETNILGTFNTLEVARRQGVSKYIFASSGAPLGEVQPPIHEELAAHPVSPYGASKLAGEAYCSAYYRTYGVNTVALRFGNVYGPHSTHKSSVVAKFIQQILKGEMLEVYGDGTQTRDFIFIDDLINAIIKTVTTDVSGEIFQIATGGETTINELLKMVLSIFRSQGIENIVSKHVKNRPGDVQRNYSDTSKARKVLNWRTEVSLNQGLQETVRWFLKEQKSVNAAISDKM
jgi:UDP-glucose 4-epimerase